MLVEYRENYEIKKHTTFKVGGKVNKVWLPKTQQELVYLLKELKNYILLGNCSNILFSTNGYKGDVILTTKMTHYEINGTRIIADCGVKGPLLAQKACEASLTGFEFMIGFPGTIGGEIYMNASCHGQAISDCVIRCCLFDKEKKEVIYKEKNEMDFAYRKSILQDGRYILLGAEFELQKSNKEDIQALLDRNLAFRKDVQPSLATPNAGSVFKNPENDSAGRLLDKAGVKDFDLENVKVWDNHANFIVNDGTASSRDVYDLILTAKAVVKEKLGINLHEEIHYVGEFK